MRRQWESLKHPIGCDRDANYITNDNLLMLHKRVIKKIAKASGRPGQSRWFE